MVPFVVHSNHVQPQSTFRYLDWITVTVAGASLRCPVCSLSLRCPPLELVWSFARVFWARFFACLMGPWSPNVAALRTTRCGNLTTCSAALRASTRAAEDASLLGKGNTFFWSHIHLCSVLDFIEQSPDPKRCSVKVKTLYFHTSVTRHPECIKLKTHRQWIGARRPFQIR